MSVARFVASQRTDHDTEHLSASEHARERVGSDQAA